MKTFEDFGQWKLIIIGLMFCFPKKGLVSFVLWAITLREQENVSAASVDPRATPQSQTWEGQAA